MNDLNYQISKIVDKIQIIPPSRGFWVNRTEDGEHYESFLGKRIIGLNIQDIKLSQLDEIRRTSTQPRSTRVDRVRAKEAIHAYFQKANAKKIRETLDPKKKASIVAGITLRANQTHNFVFELHIGDYVAIPSSHSEFISIGRVADAYLQTGTYLPLQRSIDWIGQFKKTELDPVIFKAFSSHLAFYDIQKYKDVILRTLYDFYFEGDEGNLVLNLGHSGKISSLAESKFLHYFHELFNDFIIKNELDLDINDLGTIVNLNSEGKRKLFGGRTISLVAALFLTVAIEGDSMNSSRYNPEIGQVVASMQQHLNQGTSTNITGADLRQAADSMQVKEQRFFKKVMDATNEEMSSLDSLQKKINSYY